MITRILVPTDFSKAANNALTFALHFAKKCKADVHVLNVTSIPVADAYFPAELYSSIVSELEASSKEQFKQLKKTYKDTNFKYVEASSMGFVYDEISSYAKKNKIDLLVMGTTGASGFKKILIGSNTASVVAKSEIPVLVIPPSATYHELKKIVYSTDYSEPEFPAVSRLVYLAELFDADVTVLHVKSEYDHYFNADKNFFVKNKKHISYSKWKMAKTDDDNIMNGINSYLKKKEVDLLVVAKHNRTFFDKLLHRSLSKQMVFHAKTPLLVLNK